MVIVGSSAAQFWGVERREPKDIDVWVREGEYIQSKSNWDIHVLPDDIMDLVESLNLWNKYVGTNILYTIKCSHFQWDIHWEKTKLDILHYKAQGFTLIPELYYKLLKHWKKEHGDKSFLSLNKDKEQFFTDKVYYVYDHDYLHELVAYPNKPMYTKCLQENKEVLIDKNKFGMLSFEEQIRMFREEITVIACERWLLNPKNKEGLSWYQAYRSSLKKVIISLTKGWATDFIIQNLEKFIIPDFSYFKHILKTLKEDEMSNVDLEIFKELAKERDENINYVVFKLCGGNINWGSGYKWKNKYPSYKLKKEDKEEYLRLQALRDEEMDNNYSPYVNKIVSKWGYEHLEQDGGGEGGSEYCYGVFKLKGKIYKAEYSYYSYHGHEYDYILDTLREVKPVEKMITVYE